MTRPALSALSATAARVDPIIDAHIHLFDPRRPGGVPWPDPSDAAIYKPALPDRYAAIAAPFGVVGAIAIEASPLPVDNDWVLRTAADNPIIVGVVGDLIPGSADYVRDLERLHANPLFVGIRYGNLWNRDLGLDLKKPGFVAGLKALAGYRLVLDTGNPDADLIRAAVDVADRVPELRIVIDHLPRAPIPAPGDARDAYWSHLHHLASNRNVFIKLSEIPVRNNGKIPLNEEYYRDHLDVIWDIFGEDHILFGSDWPNSDHLVGYAETLGLVRSYVSQKTETTQRKFFWKNSIAAYRWQSRRADQRALLNRVI